MKSKLHIKTGRLLLGLVLFGLTFLYFEPVNTVPVYAAQSFYEAETRTELTQGLTYITNKIVTDAGLLDVYVLKMDLKNAYLSVKPVNSSAEYGLKEPVSKLLGDDGAIAGINGDFFGVSGSYSVPIGLEVRDGRILSLSEGNNAGKEDSASLFIDKSGNPFSGYLKSSLSFLNNGIENINLMVINRVSDLSAPALITSAAMADTSSIDARVKNSVKLVVQDGYISYISGYGETVAIPENGYVIAMNEETAKYKLNLFAVGQKAEVRADYSVDLNNIEFAVSGSDVILKNGLPVQDSGALSTNRHPRTAIGYSQDKNTLIMLVVDGRTHSIGATFEELSGLMIKYGAYEAINLDGGGSSAMAVKETGSDILATQNTLSDGKERNVVNAVGVYSSAPVSAPVKLEIKPSASLTAVNAPVALEVYGLDIFNHKITLSPEELKISILGGNAELREGKLYAREKGTVELKAEWMGLSTLISIKCSDIKEIVPSVKDIKSAAGKEIPISFIGIDEDGKSIELSYEAVVCQVVPDTLGRMENGVFTALSSGSGYIKCAYGGVAYHIPVVTTLVPAQDFTFGDAVSFNTTTYPAEGTWASAANVGFGSNDSIELRYGFSASEQTQAAYLNFEPGITLPTNAAGLSLSVSGDNSGNWLRGKITDAAGNSFLIDFERYVNFAGFKTVFAMLPSEAAAPVTLDRIYIASLGQGAASTSALVFSSLKALTDSEPQAMPDIPENSKYKDKLLFENNTSVTGQDITFLPSMKIAAEKRSKDYAALRDKAVKELLKSSEGGVYLDSEPDMADAQAFKYSKTPEFNAFGFRDSQVITLNTSKGGLIASDAASWPKLKLAMIYTYTKNIIICTDISPLAFSTKREFELLHSMLVEFAEQGKNVYVISGDGTANETLSMDGVRYIRAAGMYNSDGTQNPEFSVIRFRLFNGDAYYRFDKVFG